MLRLTLSDFSQKEEVVAMPDVLQYAALFTSFEEGEIEEYAVRCGEMCLMTEVQTKQLQESMLAFLRSDFAAYDEVVVWHGSTAGDRLFYYMVCSLVDAPLWEVDMECVREMLPNKDVAAISLGVCSMDNLKSLLADVHRVDDGQKREAAEKWAEWSKSEAALRVLGAKGEVVEADEEIYDEALLGLCRGEWCVAPRVVGRLLCEVDFGVGDSFLHHRMISLARTGRLCVRPNAKCSRESQSGVVPHVVNGVELTELRMFEVKS